MNDKEVIELSGGNRILAALPNGEFAKMAKMFERVELNFEAELFRRGEHLPYVFFPLSGVISLLGSVAEGHLIEVGLIGREGLVGLSVYLGVTTATNTAIVQGNGVALRIKSADFVTIAAKRGELPVLLRRFAQSRISQVSQLAACYRFHLTEARLARWLLMTSDRMQDSNFAITQDFLANMLGVRREAVNRASMTLQQHGLISHSRGQISIVDRSGLETFTCSCYQSLKDDALSLNVES